MLLACEGYLEACEIRVVAGADYEGTPAIDSVTIGMVIGDWSFQIREHVYLDAESFLLLATAARGGRLR